MQLNNQDFRTKLYEKYISCFKSYIGNETSANPDSDYEMYRRRFLPLLKDFKNDSRIIEFGCGTGYFMRFLQQQGFNNLYGIDISPQQIQKAKEKGLNVSATDIFTFFNENQKKYDVVFALDFVEHFHKEEILSLFTSVNELLEEGGILIMHTPNGAGLYPQNHIYGDLTHLTIFSPNSMIQILRVTGFDHISFFETAPEPKNFTGFVRVVLWKFVRFFVNAVRMIETGKKEEILTQDFICTARKSRRD